MISFRIFFKFLLFLFIFQLSCLNGPEIIDDKPGSTSHKTVTLDSSNFDSLVTNSPTVALVEFYSPHCGTCTDLMWVIDSIAYTKGEQALIGAVNTDSNDILNERFSIEFVPTYLLFKNGIAVKKISYQDIKTSPFDKLSGFLETVLGTDTVEAKPESNSKKTVALDSSNFDSLVVASEKVALVEFYSPSCFACSITMKVIDSIADIKGDQALIGLVNTKMDSLYKRFSVTDIPTYILFKNGIAVKKVTYSEIQTSPFDSLTGFIQTALAPEPDTIPQGFILLDSLNIYPLINVENRISLVEFFSPKCHTCLEMESTLSHVSELYAGRALIGRVNILVDNVLHIKFVVQAVPSFHFLKGGKEVRRFLGAVSEESITAVLDSLLQAQ